MTNSPFPLPEEFNAASYFVDRHIGEGVSPVEIENQLLEHPHVQEAAVVGRKDEDGLVKTVACVVKGSDNHERSGTAPRSSR